MNAAPTSDALHALALELEDVHWLGRPRRQSTRAPAPSWMSEVVLLAMGLTAGAIVMLLGPF